MKNKLVFTIFLTACLSTASLADVKRSDLIDSIASKSTKALEDQLLTTSLSKSEIEESKKKIEARCKDFSSTVSSLPMENVSDGLADWIEISLVAELNGLGLHFLDPEAKDSAFTAYKRDALKIFPSLTNEKAQKMLAKRDTVIGQVKEYDEKVREYYFDVFSKVSGIKVDVDRMVPSGFPDFVQALKAARQVDERPIYGLDAAKPSIGVNVDLDASSSKIDSQLMDLAFVRDIYRRMSTFERIDWFVSYSIISPLYDDTSKLSTGQRKSFEDLKATIDETFAKGIKIKDGEAEVDGRELARDMSDIYMQLPWSVKTSASPEKSSESFVVAFSSTEQDWQLLKNGSFSIWR